MASSRFNTLLCATAIALVAVFAAPGTIVGSLKTCGGQSSEEKGGKGKRRARRKRTRMQKEYTHAYYALTMHSLCTHYALTIIALCPHYYALKYEK